MGRSHDIEGQFYVFSTAEAGRENSVFSGYRPQHKIHDNYQTLGHHEFVNATKVALGQTVLTKVWFITPDVYPNSLWVGREIGVFEGSRQVGILTVIRIVNDVLIGSPESYNPVWVAPASLDAQGRKIVG